MTLPETELLSTVKGNFDDYQRRFRYSKDPREWGELTRRIQIKGINELSNTVQHLNDKIVQIEEDEFKGPNEARAFLNSLNSYVDSILKDCKRQHEIKQKDVENYYKEFDNAFSYLRMHIGREERFALNYWIKKAYESLKKYTQTNLQAEAYRVIIGMLDEGLINDDGKKQRPLKEEIRILLDDVQLYKDNLLRLSNELLNKKKDLENAIIGFRSCRDLSIDIIKLRDITRSIVNEPSAYSTSLMNDVIDALSQKDSFGVITQRSQIRYQVNRNKQKLVNTLLLECKEKCNEIKRYSIARLLIEKKNIIGNYINMSRPMLRTANHGAGENIYVEWLATSNPDENYDIRRIVEYIFTIKNYQQGMHRRYLNQLTDNYRIIFASEKGTFLIERIANLREMREDYLRIRPSSTDIRIDFRDIIKEEGTIQQRAAESAFLGRIFGYLIEQKDPETGYNYIYLKYHDESIRETRVVKLSENWKTLEDYLSQKQIDKEVIHKDTAETPLETLEKLLDKKGKTPKTKKDKDALGIELSNYLEGLKSQLEGKESNPEFIRQLNIIQVFRNKYQIPVVTPDKNDNGNKNPLTPSEEKFCDDLKKLIGKKGVNREFLVKRGIILWKLTHERAEKFFDEVSSFNRDKLYKAYYEVVETCIIEGVISSDDRALLKEKQNKLGLTDQEVRDIEAKFTNINREEIYNQYREVVKSCLINNQINPDDQTLLREQQKELGLTEEESKRIEEEVVNG
jgi:hypothetical protein